MAALEDIAYFQKKTVEELNSVKQALYRLELPAPTPAPTPEIFINLSEVKRILGVSATTIISWAKYMIVVKHPNPSCPTNCYRLAEILWLAAQKYTFLSPGEIKRIIEKRKQVLGY